MKKHFKTRNPALNVPQCQEPVATHFVFGPVKDVAYNCDTASLYVGRKTLVTDIYPIKRQKQFINTLEDQIKDRGAMDVLVSDLAQVEISNKVKDLTRAYRIRTHQSEAEHQHQNPAERRYALVKQMTNALMNRTRSDPSMWLLALMYVCYDLNRTASDALKGITPLQALTGQQPDISAILPYQFNQRVIYHSYEDPGVKKEKFARWAGVAETVGDALTWILVTEDTNKVIYRSTIRAANTDTGDPLPPDGEKPTNPDIIFIQGLVDKLESDGKRPSMPVIDIPELINRSFMKPNKDPTQPDEPAVVTKVLQDEDGNTRGAIIRVGHSKKIRDELVTYNELLEYIDKENEKADKTHDDTEQFWTFDKILSHHGPIKPTDPDYKGSRYNLEVLWENGEKSMEPLHTILEDDPVTCAINAK